MRYALGQQPEGNFSCKEGVIITDIHTGTRYKQEELPTRRVKEASTSFSLYKIDKSAMKFVLDKPCALWGKNGTVPKAARGVIKQDGRWELGERDLLCEMKVPADEYAIIDDLVPKGPEILMGRIISIRGWLRQGYNPVGFHMEQVFSVDEADGKLMGELQRKEKKAEFAIPGSPAPIIRSIGHLYNGWQTAGSFKGALLADDQWEYFREKL